MLSRFHVVQPIRTYTEPKSNRAGVCIFCSKDVFTPQLRKSLAEQRHEASVTYSYSRPARDLHASVLAGCPWCACIENAILTCADLDYWMEAWNGSGSDGGSLVDEYEDQEESGDDPDDEEMEDVEDEDEASDKQAGFHTIDSLNCEAKLKITMEFLKWNGNMRINLVKVTTEVTASPGDESPLQDMVGDKAVVVKLEVAHQTASTMGSEDATVTVNPCWHVVSAASFENWVPHAETWIQACKTHASCSPSGVFRPTRLVDVGDPQHPRLIISAQEIKHGAQVPYMALSYVWGPKQDYVLTQARLSDMCKGLDSTRLPPTLSDAMAAASQLGFRYLWIDALCIMQDSVQDKALELPRMADTYKESELTLIVASAAGAGEGFLKPPSSETPRFLLGPFQVDSESGLEFGYRLPYKASADPISSRAWTLQERVLSRRLLVFSSSGVMWMCREDFVNPGAAPDAGPPYQTFLDPYLSEEHQTIDATHQDKDDRAEAQIRETWTAIRADYTEMDLSYCSDRLPAISALAAEIGRKTGWTYLAGMWKENLFSELHWRCMKHNQLRERMTLKPNKVKEAGYLAPSWSWASVGIGTVVDSEDDRNDRQVFDGFSILECHVDTVDPRFAYGPVTGGFLEVEGKVVELGWRYEDSPSWDGSDISLVLADGQHDLSLGVAVGDGTLDPLDEPLDRNLKVVCLGMSKLRLGRQRIVPVEGLILAPVPKATGDGRAVFRRIGFFRMAVPTLFGKAASRKLVIE
ncbi:Heterokaryon incompatibility protein (HET) domain containing protein [Naviculisporaceae sp. PSN 640]